MNTIIGILFASTVSAGALGPENAAELVRMAYPETYKEFGEFVPLPSAPWVSVANNDTATMKIMDFTASSFPLHPGEIDFMLEQVLEKEFPVGTTMDVVGFSNSERVLNTTFNMCDYMPYGELYCPLAAHQSAETLKQSLLVPDDVKSARYSFVATLRTPDQELVACVAALVDMLESNPHRDL